MPIFGVLMVFIIIACILLVLVVLSQNPKGGGLSSTFGGGGTQMFGVQKTNNFMEKATWTLAAVIVIFSILASVMIAKPTVYSTPVQAPVQKEASQPQPSNNTAQPLKPTVPTPGQ